jgi:hypothetical protein
MKEINIFHLVVVFPLILALIYKDSVTIIDQNLLKNLVRILVTLGIINHSYKLTQ